MVRTLIVILSIAVLSGCQEDNRKPPDVQALIDSSIQVAGGEYYQNSDVRFLFRDKAYEAQLRGNKKTLKRVTFKPDSLIEDIKTGKTFSRLVNGEAVVLPDSLAGNYANSVNSVHYFAYLPYGLNDPAVKKRLLGRSQIDGEDYYEIEVTFTEEGGGSDYEDVYVYWINTATMKPDYLAYEFHTDDGGFRFREAYNERYIGGLRFVDYKNYEPATRQVIVSDLDSLFVRGELKLLSEIKLDSITVSRGSYN